MSTSHFDSPPSLFRLLFEKSLWLAGRVLQLIPPETEMTILTGINRGQRWVRGSANAPEWLGIYEASKQRLVAKMTTPGMLVFDVGANAGFYTLALSRLVGTAGRVVAFEPFPRNCAKIRKHLAINRTENVILVESAVAAEEGKVFFEAGGDDFTGKIGTQGTIEVPTVALDGYVENEKLGDPDLIKIDVEGAESQVLAGALQILQRSSPIIMLALHGAEQRRLCYDLLVKAGYEMTNLHGEKIDRVETMPDEVIALRNKR